MAASILDFDQISVSFGVKSVVKKATARIEERSIVGILGPNGSGKSTTLRAIAGCVPIESGALCLNGQNITAMPVAERVALGLTLVPQGRHLFGSMTVEENLTMGAFLRNQKAEIKLDLEKVFSFVPELKDIRNRRANELSGGQQQFVAVARGVMARPRVLMLDEPSLGVAPKIVERLSSLLLQLRAALGITIVLVEQNVPMALSLAERVLVFRGGRIALNDDSVVLKDRVLLEEIYFGNSDGELLND